MNRVVVVSRRATPAELHAADPFRDWPQIDDHGVSVVSCDYDRGALVLGSSQGADIVDQHLMVEGGLELVTRRSGGGAVLMRPGDLVWIDVVARSGLLPDDVRRSMIVVGHAWKRALDGVGCGFITEVHEGGMLPNQWGHLVCFAGLGPGEVVVGDRKLVGLSQRRTRAGVRISGAIHRRDLVGETAALLRGPLPSGEPAPAAAWDGFATAALCAALASELSELISSSG